MSEREKECSDADSAVERVAKVLCACDGQDWEQIPEGWSTAGYRTHYRELAVSAIQAFLVDVDAVLIGTLESLYDSLDAEKDLVYLKAIGYALIVLRGVDNDKRQ